MSPALKFAPHYTLKDYAQWKGDWELWEGLAVAMSPSPFGRHQTALTRLSHAFRDAVTDSNCHAETIVELDWIIAEDTVVRPDVMIVCGDPPEKHMHETPALVAEILSDTTRQNDLTYKRQLYHRQGVEAYLIVDPAGENNHGRPTAGRRRVHL